MRNMLFSICAVFELKRYISYLKNRLYWDFKGYWFKNINFHTSLHVLKEFQKIETKVEFTKTIK